MVAADAPSTANTTNTTLSRRASQRPSPMPTTIKVPPIA